VEDGKYGSVDEDSRPAMFIPLAQGVGEVMSTSAPVLVRSRLSPDQIAVALRHTLTRLEPSVPFTRESLGRRRRSLDESRTHRCGSARGDGSAGCHAGRHRRLRHGLLFRLQTREGAGDSLGSGSATAARSPLEPPTPAPDIGVRLGPRVSSRHADERCAGAPGPFLHGSRSAGPGWSAVRHDAFGSAGDLDSRAARARDRPRTAPARIGGRDHRDHLPRRIYPDTLVAPVVELALGA
jgi:hypothetical protein